MSSVLFSVLNEGELEEGWMGVRLLRCEETGDGDQNVQHNITKKKTIFTKDNNSVFVFVVCDKGVLGLFNSMEGMGGGRRHHHEEHSNDVVRWVVDKVRPNQKCIKEK